MRASRASPDLWLLGRRPQVKAAKMNIVNQGTASKRIAYSHIDPLICTNTYRTVVDKFLKTAGTILCNLKRCSVTTESESTICNLCARPLRCSVTTESESTICNPSAKIIVASRVVLSRRPTSSKDTSNKGGH